MISQALTINLIHLNIDRGQSYFYLHDKRNILMLYVSVNLLNHVFTLTKNEDMKYGISL